MADKENTVRLTRAAAKRVATAGGVLTATSDVFLGENQPAKKRKRVPLQDLPHLANVGCVVPSRRFIADQKPYEKNVGKKKVVPEPSDASSLCEDYASNIEAFLRSMEMEKKRRPNENYIEEVQKDISPNMRAILVDWLVEVADEYKLVPETLYLTVSYVDRFLSATALNRQKLQLLGVSCMLIASKYEEISPPRIHEFCDITDNTYTKQEVVKMEADVLRFLKFEMGGPTIHCFLRTFTSAIEEEGKSSSLKLKLMCNYLAELSLVDYSCVQFLPSEVAAATLFVAKFIINPNIHPWSPALKDLTGYRPSQLKQCIHTLHNLHLNKKGSSLVAVKDKYKHLKFSCISMITSPPEIPQNYLEDK